MNIAILQSFLPSKSNGGVGHFTHQLANCLVASGHEVTVFSLDPRPSNAQYKVILPGPGESLLKSRFGTMYGFAIWLAQHDFSAYDVVHAMGDNQFLRTSTPVVRTIHGAALAEAWHARKLSSKLMFLSIYFLELLGVARASVAVGVSRNSNTYFPWVTRVINEAVDLRFFSPGDVKSLVPSILFVGHRLHDRKRANLLIDVFANSVRPALPDAELWLVCDDMVEAAGVQCFSNLPIERLADLYRRAWVFCLPSSYEGFGRPYLEAMASGTPVVATRNPGALEVLDGGHFGLIAPDFRLGEELVTILTDAPTRDAMRAAGLQRARDFDWPAAVEQYERLYAQAAGREQTGAFFH